MNADDKRHGSNAGYVAGCRCAPCCDGSWRYHKRLHVDHARGHYRHVDATGTRRRIEALAYLGWSGVQIGELVGMSAEHVRQLRHQQNVTRNMAALIAEAYDRLSMQRPPETTRTERHNASRQRGLALRRGWLPPLAWDDIDRDEAPHCGDGDNLPDPVVVDRILAGDWPLKATREERLEVIDRWPGSDNELEKRTGWNVARDRRYVAAIVADEEGAA